ncbi:RNA polymerase II-associated factor 1-like protein antimeros [Arctopsyche grandis]|uniref:RNA polymerase II-associated factor 1-like protein antimeros n=1 Tax=Arctopsyche grandis TaxID=121162 RepID=UPI00406D91DC
MPPTVQTGAGAGAGAGQGQGGAAGASDKRPTHKEPDRKSDLVCRVKYGNTLPDIPFDLKFIKYPFDPNRFIHYNPTSLERNYKFEVLTEHDLGVSIDLINKDIYQNDTATQLDPADEKLLEEDVLTPQDSKRSRHHAKSVSWLRRSEYISTEQTRFNPQSMEKVEAKVGYNVKKSLGEETLYMDRDSQIKAIEKTFEDNKKTIDKHYSKPGVVPVEVLPVYPDFSLWKYPCAQVIFDSDPAPQDKPVAAQIEQMSQAMIRGVMDESGEQFVAYFLPTDETLVQKKSDVTEGIPYNDEAQYEYKMAREYNWNVKSKASKGYEENYFLVVRDGNAYYNELETRVRLSKRRARAGAGVGGPGGTRLVVRHRPLTEYDHRMQRLREKQLEPPQEEEDEEELEQEDDERVQPNVTTRNSRSRSRSQSNSPAGSKEGSPKGSRNRSGSGSEAGSRASSKESAKASREASRERSESRERSRSKSASSQGSKKNGSRASSRASSKSRSRSRSGSRSKAGSEAGSPASSRKSRSKSRSGSERSASGSREGSASGSRQGSKNGSRSASASSRSSANSGSDSE